MNIRKIRFFIYFFISIPFVSKATTDMPIIAFWGVPDTMTYERCFLDFHECDFNVSIYPYWSIESLTKACITADKIQRIKKLDSTHIFYVNLIPYYRQDWFRNNSIPRHVNKHLQEEAMKTRYSVNAGDLLLFKLQ